MVAIAASPILPLRPLRIGPVALATNLLMAPIAGWSDLAFRLIVRSCGSVGLASTDLLCPEGVLRETRRSMELAATCPEDSPLCIQLYGSATDRLCEAARWAEDHGAAVVDLNMGCPVDKVTKKDGGSKLLCDPDRTLRMVERLMASLRRVPLTCKMRLGWNDRSIVAPYLASRLEQAGVKLLTVHGRTTEMRFSGQARLDGIAEVVAAVKSIPVIGNGDVRTPRDAERMLRVTGCAGVMIGRGALGYPWIFRDAWSYLTTGTIPPQPTLEEKVELIRRHFAHAVRLRGERIACVDFRKRVVWYGKHLGPCRTLKEDLRMLSAPAQFDAAIERFLDWRRRHDEDVRAGRRPAAAPEEPEVEERAADAVA